MWSLEKYSWWESFSKHLSFVVVKTLVSVSGTIGGFVIIP